MSVLTLAELDRFVDEVDTYGGSVLTTEDIERLLAAARAGLAAQELVVAAQEYQAARIALREADADRTPPMVTDEYEDVLERYDAALDRLCNAALAATAERSTPKGTDHEQ